MGVHGATRHQYHGTTWTTPRDFYDGVAARYGPFTLDAAANHDNALAATYYTEENDGLRQPWPGRVWPGNHAQPMAAAGRASSLRAVIPYELSLEVIKACEDPNPPRTTLAAY